MTYEICVAALTFAFIGLSAYLIFFLKTFKKTLESLNQTLGELRIKISPLAEETTLLAKTSNQLIENIFEKTESLNFLFNYLNEFNSSVNRKMTHKDGHKFSKIEEDVTSSADWVEIAALAVLLWKKNRKGVPYV